MGVSSTRKVISVLIMLFMCDSLWAQTNYCDIPDVGTLKPGGVTTNTSIMHIWQGAVNGTETKNSDRITGLYDFDLYYLLTSTPSDSNIGDYFMLAVSTQAAFGNGVSGSKVGSFFELNENAKGDYAFIIDKLYSEFTLANRILTFDVGKIDLEDFFDGSAVAGCEKGQFLARPLFKNGAIPFPGKGLGVRGLYKPGDFWYFQAAVADAHGDKRETGFNTAFGDDADTFSIAEIGIMPKLFNMPGTYRFIIWYDPQSKSYLNGNGRTKDDDCGAALSFDQQISSKTTLFARYGIADESINEVEDFVSFGGQVKGLINGRDNDVFAVGYAQGLRSTEGLSDEQARIINLIETYYSIAVNRNIIITPSIQFVMEPGGLKDQSAATVFGIRCRIKF